MSIILNLLILLGLLGGIIWCMRRGFLRTLVSIGVLFLSTLFAALLYGPLISVFTANLGNPSSGRTAGAIVFGGLMILFVALLEALVHRNYPGLRSAKPGTVNTVLSAFFGVIWSMYVISLVLLVLEFGSQSIGGSVSFISDWIRQAGLVAVFRAFFSVPLIPIRLLFQGNLPEVLVFFSPR